MALRFGDSFEPYASGNLLQMWTLGSGSIIPGGRNGQGLQVGAGASIQKTLDYQSTWILGFAVNFGTVGFNTSLCFFGAPFTSHVGATLAVVTIENDGTVSAYGGTTHLIGNSAGTLVLHANTWYYFEVKVTYSGSSPISVTTVVKVNGQTIINGTAITGINSTDLIIQDAKSDYFGISGLSGFGNTIFDDVYICDGTGIVNNDFLGDIKILAVYPITDETTQWTPIGGVSHFSLVNEHPPDDDTTYIESNTVGQIDDFLFQPISTFSGTVPGVLYSIYARKDDEGTRSIKHTVSGAPPVGVPEIFLSDLYVYTKVPFDTDPDGGGWTVGAFNVKHFGVKLIQ